MVDIARVNLYGQPVGTFRWDNNRRLAQFEYADSFIGKGLEPSPILMPVRKGRVYFRPVPQSCTSSTLLRHRTKISSRHATLPSTFIIKQALNMWK